MANRCIPDEQESMDTRTCRTKAQAYLIMHKLPPHPQVDVPKQGTTETGQNNTHDNSNNNNNNNKYRYRQTQDTNNDDNDDNHEGHNEIWPGKHNGIKVIVDSKQLCDTINGAATLDYNNEEDYNNCNNITNRLIQLHHLGFTPAHKHLDPIEWRSRVLNKGADRWCNQVLDQQHNSFQQYNNSRSTHNHNTTDNEHNHNNNSNDNHNTQDNTTQQWPNVFIQSDGGCRYKGSSSTGWRIMAKHNNTTETIVEGGTLHPGNEKSLRI